MATFISPRANISKGAFIGTDVKIYGNTTIEEGVVIEDNVIIGKPSNKEIVNIRGNTKIEFDTISIAPTVIKFGSYIGSSSIIYSGSTIEEFVEFEDFCKVGYNTKVGTKTRLMYNAQVYHRIAIGCECRISGFVCNDTVIKNRVSFFGSTVHKYKTYANKDQHSPAPVILDDVIVGFNTLIVGGITLGVNSFIGPMLVISKDVLENEKVFSNR